MFSDETMSYLINTCYYGMEDFVGGGGSIN
jgi:hypothetical protein